MIAWSDPASQKSILNIARRDRLPASDIRPKLNSVQAFPFLSIGCDHLRHISQPQHRTIALHLRPETYFRPVDARRGTDQND
jgi:hypothetical protein